MTNQEISNLIDEKFEKVRQELTAQLCPKWEFSEDEKVILRNLQQRYKWIARDIDGRLFIFVDRPMKDDYYWASASLKIAPLNTFDKLFQQITWHDEEPCEFRKFI